jgi:hypothetical protein
VLQRLLTLSLRLSMALCTKPPMPFVGDAERSRSGEILPWVGDMASARAARSLSPPSTEEPCSEGGANFWESSIGRGVRPLTAESESPPDIEVLVEKRLLIMVLPRTEPPREPGELERTLSVGGLPISCSVAESRDMPGNCRRPDTDPVSEAASSWFFLKAAEPLPPSGVCRKKAGSLAPKEAAMELLDMLGSGEEGSGVLLEGGRSGDRDATERGRRMLPDCGLCFQDKVPVLPRAAALVAGFLGSMSSRVIVVDVEVGGGELVSWCSESSRAASREGGLMAGVGVVAAFSWTAWGVPATERGDWGVYGLSGEIERARSIWQKTSAAGRGGRADGRCRGGEKTNLLVALVARCGPG